MTLEANDLILFAHVAAVGSFAGAARRTGMPKSTLSRRITALETALGERLLTRGTRRALALTEFGEGILDHGQRMLDELTTASDLANNRQVIPRGLMRVSFPPEFQELSLLHFLQEFVARYPHVHLELDISPHRVDMREGRFDLAVRIARRLPDDANLVARPLTVLPHGLFASPAYLSHHGIPEGPGDLANHVGLSLIGSNGESQPWSLSRGDEHCEVMPRGPVAANSISLQSALAMGGTGIFGMSERFALPLVSQGLLQRVLPQWQLPTATAWAVTHGRRLLPMHTRVFIDLLHDMLARLS
ncbi:LysR family transcriptional regulator [Rhodoferax sp.]|uniref:LysR family transcriptional regulator n=1 Tax=Rhodoferax sp. TaxID=50421 RepID=UPI0025DF3F21|nr:LysR family transcriptional regulator [Rhodoferax sp.]MCM2339734.1 LysR family transcriptional regulator [Rhodoferax sp.]